MGGQSSQQVIQSWSTSGDVPVPGDFDGDGKTDFSIFRPSANEWWILRSSDTTYTTYNFGANGDIPVPADYDGDGHADIGVWRNSNYTSYSKNSTNGQTQTNYLQGISGTPTSGDYDGDGRADVAVWSPSDATWYTGKARTAPLYHINSEQQRICLFRTIMTATEKLTWLCGERLIRARKEAMSANGLSTKA
ncbi:MAG: VCBS repeat-containing protein [Pyrinomonadaceae bacterium]